MLRISLCATALAVAMVGCTAKLQSTATNDGGDAPDASDSGAPDAPIPDGDAPSGVFAWTTGAPLSIPRTDHQVAATNGKVYVLGGYSGSMLARVDAYDPVANAWSQKADMPEARRAFASGVIGGKIYVSGGMSFTDYNAVTYLKSTRIYDPVADTWSSGADCPLGGAPNAVWGNLFVGGGVLGGKLVVFESTSGGTSMHSYDPAMNAWTTTTAAAFNGAQVTTATIADTLYLFASPYGPGQQVGALFSFTSGSWVIRKNLPDASRSALFAMNGKIYSASGIKGDSATYKATPKVWQYDPMTEAWTDAGALGVAREYAGAAVLDGKVYVIGGDVPSTGATDVPTATIEIGTPR